MLKTATTTCKNDLATAVTFHAFLWNSSLTYKKRWTNQVRGYSTILKILPIFTSKVYSLPMCFFHSDNPLQWWINTKITTGTQWHAGYNDHRPPIWQRKGFTAIVGCPEVNDDMRVQQRSEKKNIQYNIIVFMLVILELYSNMHI